MADEGVVLRVPDKLHVEVGINVVDCVAVYDTDHDAVREEVRD